MNKLFGFKIRKYIVWELEINGRDYNKKLKTKIELSIS